EAPHRFGDFLHLEICVPLRPSQLADLGLESSFITIFRELRKAGVNGVQNLTDHPLAQKVRFYKWQSRHLSYTFRKQTTQGLTRRNIDKNIHLQIADERCQNLISALVEHLMVHWLHTVAIHFLQRVN